MINTSVQENTKKVMDILFKNGADNKFLELPEETAKDIALSEVIGFMTRDQEDRDVLNDIMTKVLEADVVAWATPIYYYEMSGQMKTLIDRMNAMYSQDYKFHDVYLLTTAAEDEEETPKRAEIGLTGWIDCYPKSRLAGTLFCGGVNEPREIEGNSKLQEAFELGRSI